MKQLPSALKYLCIASAMFCLANTGLAQNLVQDPGFEMSPGAPPGTPGGFSSAWTLTPPAGIGAGQQLSRIGTDAAFAHSGTRYAALEFSGTAATASLSQILTTVAGAVYNVSFWLANNSAAPLNSFQVLINGVTLSTNFGTLITSPAFPNDGGYRLVTASFLATNPGSTLEFRYRHDQDFWRLDDVSVTQQVPEGGATLWLMLPLFAGICLYHFRLRSRRAVS